MSFADMFSKPTGPAPSWATEFGVTGNVISVGDFFTIRRGTPWQQVFRLEVFGSGPPIPQDEVPITDVNGNPVAVPQDSIASMFLNPTTKMSGTYILTTWGAFPN